jgi:PAS domain-containing protein
MCGIVNQTAKIGGCGVQNDAKREIVSMNSGKQRTRHRTILAASTMDTQESRHIQPPMDSETPTASMRVEDVMPYLEPIMGLSLNNLEDGYYEVNLRGEFTLVNEALCRILNVTKTDMLHGFGRSFRAFTDAENADKTERAFNHVYRTGQALRALEGKAFLADASQIYLERRLKRHWRSVWSSCPYCSRWTWN